MRPNALAALDDPGVRGSLSRYVDIVKGSKYAKYLVDRSIRVDFDAEASYSDLWEIHSRELERYANYEKGLDDGSLKPRDVQGHSFLDLKIELARRIMRSCHFCVRRCGVDRIAGESGYCGCGVELDVSNCFPHTGEEPELVPSGTVFTCGCTMRCILCQNWEISQWREKGSPTTPARMADIVESLKAQGCRNLNMVGGDPTPNCWLWLSTMKDVDANIATVWNSNSYYSEETSKLLAGFIDLYLLDFKYGPGSHAEEIADAPGYWEAATRNHLAAKRHGELIVRVLVLPGHNDCCTRPIINWIAGNLGPTTRVNLMFQYRPEWRAHEREELRRGLTRREIDEALQIAKEAGLTNLVHE